MSRLNNPVYYQIANPYLLTVKIELEEVVRERMVRQVLDQVGKAEYHGGYTFEVMDSKIHRDFSTLYNNFLDIAKEIFGPFTLSTKQKHWCWANVYNKDTFRTNMHTHELTSTINAVFYLNMPKDVKLDEAGIMIGYDGQEHVFLPDECELILMPNWMGHGPMPHSSNENRISINMEICTTEDVHELFTLDRIYLKCKAQIE